MTTKPKTKPKVKTATRKARTGAKAGPPVRRSKAAAAKRSSPPVARKKAKPAARSGAVAPKAKARKAAVPARAGQAKGAKPPVLDPVSEATLDAGASSGPGCYVYCIIRSDQPLSFGPIGIGAQPSEVRTISYKDLVAVVSDTPLEVYDPTRENVLAHERVNDTVMREHTVLPMSFGTVFKTPQDIVELMRSAYDAFKDVLAKMENKVEFGLKILWEPEAVIREIERRDENLRRLKEEISSQRGSTYFARMQYGRLVDSLLQERSTHIVAEIFETLRDAAIASRSNKPIGDKMILNAAFLVARDREAEFDARVKELGARHEQLNIRYTGPWPPYNFVNVRLKLERAAEG